jgi:hypothetical protein
MTRPVQSKRNWRLLTTIAFVGGVMTPTIINAFSTMPFPVPRGNTGNDRDTSYNSNDISTADSKASLSPSTTTTSVSTPWRIVLNIGREPLSRMPFDWARSGCRMPLVVPCDFNEKNSLVVPQRDTVSFTAADGAVVKPVLGGTWEFTYGVVDKLLVQETNKKNQPLPTGLSFSLTFPETLQRRDVTIDAGTTLDLTARVYSKTELDALNKAYYDAREMTWQAGETLNDAARRQGSAKKWNEETGRWEKRYDNENPLKMIQNQFQYWSAKAQQDAKQRQRPDANDISDRGPFPGFVDGDNDGLYVAKGGVIRASKNGAVMGTWSAEPILDRPVSYRN